MTRVEQLLFELIQVSLGKRNRLSSAPTADLWEKLFDLAQEQAVVGVMQYGLEKLHSEQRPYIDLLLEWIGTAQIIRTCNEEQEKAVIELCKELSAEDIRFIVVKGQTLAALYRDPGLRQSGDIDYLIHPDDWDMAVRYIEQKVDSGEIEGYEDDNALKHVEWYKGDVMYEMHRSLASFSCISHQRYWENVIMPEVWLAPWAVKINGYDVPTLANIYNILYVFVHIFEHFIKDGIGLRQFLDWFVLLTVDELTVYEKGLLEQHLKGIGFYNAFSGMGAILTDYLGLEESRFPFAISEKAHKQVPALIENILKSGNFGQNKEYLQDSGIVHGAQRLFYMIIQAWRFGHYAPKEAWGSIPHMFKWWRVKMLRRMN